MTRREQIIVVTMVLAAVYGGYQVLAPKARGPKPGNPSSNTKNLTPFAAEVIGKMRKLDSTPTDAYVIARGNSAWPDNPFFQGIIQQPEEEKKEENGPSMEAIRERLNFSGFLQIGDKTLVIINGLEYETGEVLMEYGYFVKSIAPRQVIIAKTDGSDAISLTLDDMDE
ncbi:MAG: hypothetical protein JEZ11_05705 [Desulfobacterales bacterium]|nr:hypothetical protein [Desulfobacterales bacterium]